MNRKRKMTLVVATIAAVMFAVGAWTGTQVGSGTDAPAETDSTKVPSFDPDYWTSERMRDATPAPMPTVD